MWRLSDLVIRHPIVSLVARLFRLLTGEDDYGQGGRRRAQAVFQLPWTAAGLFPGDVRRGTRAGRGRSKEKDFEEGRKNEAREIERAKAGDARVWEEWFGRYYANLFRYAYIRLRQRSDAEDIASQVFLEALGGIASFRYTGRPILAWLYRIAHNLVYDRQRTIDREAARLAPVHQDRDRAPGPEDTVGRIDLLQAIDALTDEQREVVVLRYFFAMPAQEVADILGKSPAAVFSLQARALIALKQRLQSETEKA
jgi:RNA polymerase sigma-70 factor (ECF subfamily)